MCISLARLDLTQIFCEVDDCYRDFEGYCEREIPRLPWDRQPKIYQSQLSMSEVMMMVIGFNGSGYRTFKDFCQQKVLAGRFSQSSQSRKVCGVDTLKFYSTSQLLNNWCLGEVTGISFIDSTAIGFCHVKQVTAHKTFKGIVDCGESLMGWYFGFKLHLIANGG